MGTVASIMFLAGGDPSTAFLMAFATVIYIGLRG